MKQRIIDPGKIFANTPITDADVDGVQGLKPTKSSIETARIRAWEEKLFRIILSSIQTHEGKTFGSIIGGVQLYLNEPVVSDLKAHILSQYLEEEAEIKKEEANKQPQPVQRPEYIPQNQVQNNSEQPQKKRRRRRGRGGKGNSNQVNNTNK